MNVVHDSKQLFDIAKKQQRLQHSHSLPAVIHRLVHSPRMSKEEMRVGLRRRERMT